MKFAIPGLLAFLLLLACESRPASPSVPEMASAPSPGVAPVAAPPAPSILGESLYGLPIPIVDQQGSHRLLDSFRGRPVLVTMFYGSCASACPLLTSDLKRIEATLPAATRANLRVLMVSFDQARDTPEVLRRLTLERGMDPGRWTLASANDDDARALAGLLGIRYRKLDNGEFFHSSVIVLLDGEGRPRVRLEGLGKDAAPILNALAASS